MAENRSTQWKTGIPAESQTIQRIAQTQQGKIMQLAIPRQLPSKIVYNNTEITDNAMGSQQRPSGSGDGTLIHA
ncbi:hypothetical protein GX51_03181 [Blastomyces parvus]|uniref:Uncharacterized protein n=1 Tax=Blastomyces parvus TaxID=2060905 RepID=A0A2B7X8H8_9EURO|nr:hypothetical protein GX51_03181 [Blastomyces parvus]